MQIPLSRPDITEREIERVVEVLRSPNLSLGPTLRRFEETFAAYIGRTSTYFGKASVLYTGGENEITATLDGPTRNPPKEIRLRFREPDGRLLKSVTVNGKAWRKFEGEWVELPGDIGKATVMGGFRR